MLFWKFQCLTTTVVLLALIQKLAAQILTNNNANGLNVEPQSVFFEDSEFPGFKTGDITVQESELYQNQNSRSAMDSNNEFETSETDINNAASGNAIEERTAAAALRNSAENAADANNGATDIAGAGANAVGGVARAAAHIVGDEVDTGFKVFGGVTSALTNILNPPTPSGEAVDNIAENADETIQNPPTNTGVSTANLNVNSPRNVRQRSFITQQGTSVQDSPVPQPIGFDQHLSNSFVSGEQKYLNVGFNDSSRQSGHQAFDSFQSQHSNDNSNINEAIKRNSSSFNSNRQTSGHLTAFSQNLGDDVPYVHPENADETIQNPPTNTGARTENFNVNSPQNDQQRTTSITQQGTLVQDSPVPQPIDFEPNLGNSFLSGQRNYLNAAFNETASQFGNQASDSFQSQQSDNNSNQNLSIKQNSSSSNSNRQSDGHLTEFSQNTGYNVPIVHRFRHFNHHRPIHSYINGQPPFLRNFQSNV